VKERIFYLIAAVPFALFVGCATASHTDVKIAEAQAETAKKADAIASEVEELQAKQKQTEVRLERTEAAVQQVAMEAQDAMKRAQDAGVLAVSPSPGLSTGEQDEQLPSLSDAEPGICQGCTPVRVFYATDREAWKAPYYFGTKYSQRVWYGTCLVSIPPGHVEGEMESPTSLIVMEGEYYPSEHVTLMKSTPLSRDRLFAYIKKRAKDGDIVVFIHGYNVTFRDAARRTAQLANDLNHRMKTKLVPLFFSWPSYGATLAYTKDEDNVQPAARHLAAFLADLVQRVGPDKKIHIIAHSMGNRVLCHALELVRAANKIPEKRFQHIVLAAPDVYRRDFDGLVDAITKSASRVTLYASKNDLAIRASYYFHEEMERAGDSRYMPIVSGIEAIDASDLKTEFFALGHSYVFSSIVADVAAVLRDKMDGRKLKTRMDGSFLLLLPGAR
jgi:esterase/lipase superfamily enzyme/outer membrane murein-binding lipoprotein Lpp